jgi:hypothetical protein
VLDEKVLTWRGEQRKRVQNVIMPRGVGQVQVFGKDQLSVHGVNAPEAQPDDLTDGEYRWTVAEVQETWKPLPFRAE